MKLSKRTISSLLLAAMLATLAACGSEPAVGGNDETTSGKASDTVTETVEKADIPEDKYEGYEFRMLGKETPATSSVNELLPSPRQATHSTTRSISATAWSRSASTSR